MVSDTKSVENTEITHKGIQKEEIIQKMAWALELWYLS